MCSFPAGSGDTKESSKPDAPAEVKEEPGSGSETKSEPKTAEATESSKMDTTGPPAASSGETTAEH